MFIFENIYENGSNIIIDKNLLYILIHIRYNLKYITMQVYKCYYFTDVILNINSNDILNFNISDIILRCNSTNDFFSSSNLICDANNDINLNLLFNDVNDNNFNTVANNKYQIEGKFMIYI